MAFMYDRVISTISKQASERTDKDIEVVIPWFKKKSDLFKSLNTDVVTDIVKNCLYFECPKDEVVIKQGDKGDRLYIILNGYVSIYISNAISDADTEILPQADSSCAYGKDDTGEKKELDRSLYGNFISYIAAGKCFGELALINKDCIRNASIITEVACDLVVVDRALYNRSLRQYQAQEFAERTNFVNESPLFRNWHHRYKKQMAMSLRKETVPFNTMIMKQGSPVDALFFILKGQAKLVVDPVMHTQQFGSFYSSRHAKDDLNSTASVTTYRFSGMLDSGAPITRAKSADSGSSKRRSNSRGFRTTEVCVIAPVEVCGDLELSLDLGTYVHSVVTNQEAIIYVLDMKNYERLVIRRNPRTIDTMKEMVEMKLQARCSRLLTGQVPLLKMLLAKLRDVLRPKMDPEKLLEREKSNLTLAWKVLELQRGPVVDLYGPGTVFYRIRMREKAKREARARAQGIVGGARLGFPIQSFGQARGSDISDTGFMPSELKLNDQLTNSNVVQSYLGTDIQIPSEYQDVASSDSVLSQLEDKIKAWHETINTNQKLSKSAVKLRRFQPEENKLPKPGKKVLIRRRDYQRMVDVEDDSGSDEFGLEKQNTSISFQSQLRLHSSRTRHKPQDITNDTDNIEAQPAGDVVDKRPIFSIPRITRGNSQKKFTHEQYEELKSQLRHQERSFGAKTHRVESARKSMLIKL